MSADKDDGGPAFPLERMSAAGILAHTSAKDNEAEYIAGLARLSHGMSLRDYFAAKEMQGELAAMSGNPDDGDAFIAGLSLEIPDHSLSRLASHWFRIADAMLKARAAQ